MQCFSSCHSLRKDMFQSPLVLSRQAPLGCHCNQTGAEMQKPEMQELARMLSQATLEPDELGITWANGYQRDKTSELCGASTIEAGRTGRSMATGQ